MPIIELGVPNFEPRKPSTPLSPFLPPPLSCLNGNPGHWRSWFTWAARLVLRFEVQGAMHLCAGPFLEASLGAVASNIGPKRLLVSTDATGL
jgi:hypothetical protein